MNKEFFEKVKTEMVGHLPGFYDSRQLLYDIILNSKPEPGSVHVEIGTLCGGGTVFMLKALQDKGALSSEYVVCVDPFTGFYEQADPIVSSATVKKNTRKFGFDPDQIVFFETLSQNPATIKALKDYTVNTVFIDGDHTYQGVKADWENFAPLVMKDGFVVFDDYVGETDGRPTGLENKLWQSTSWGQVSRFIDTEVVPRLSRSGFRFVEKTINAIAFQKNVQKRGVFNLPTMFER